MKNVIINQDFLGFIPGLCPHDPKIEANSAKCKQCKFYNGVKFVQVQCSKK